MKIQIEPMSQLLVIRIRGKTFTRCVSYLFLDNRKWNDRELNESELRRME